MTVRRASVMTALVLISLIPLSCADAATLIDQRLVGTWTLNPSDCPAALKRLHGPQAMNGGSALQVSSFVITRRSVDTPSGRCNAMVARTNESVVTLSLECWNSVSVEERTISIKIIDPDQIEYQYPRTPELSQRFTRCKPTT